MYTIVRLCMCVWLSHSLSRKGHHVGRSVVICDAGIFPSEYFSTGLFFQKNLEEAKIVRNFAGLNFSFVRIVHTCLSVYRSIIGMIDVDAHRLAAYEYNM